MILGFTGTSEGMTEQQKESFLQIVTEEKPWEFHHGLCVGSDEQAHDIIREALSLCSIVGHPPTRKNKYAHRECNFMLEPKDYLVRDKDIVAASDMLVATPLQDEEVLRSGTWATIRYARNKRIPIKIIQRNGTIVNGNSILHIVGS